MTNKVKELCPDNEVELLDANDVNARSGGEFFAKCIVAAVFAALILIVYIALRFKQISGWSAGVCAVLGLLSTLIVTYGCVVLCRFEIDSNFMAVILTLLGYAVNDTIVIYDRIRENQTLLPGTQIQELVNISDSQSLRRSIRTSVTTFSSMLIGYHRCAGNGSGFHSEFLRADDGWYCNGYVQLHLLCAEPVGMECEKTWHQRAETAEEKGSKGKRISVCFA